MTRGCPRLLGLRAFRGLGKAGGQTICTDNCTGTFSLFLSLLFFFPLLFSFVLAGRLQGDQEIGLPRLDSQ